MCQMQMSSCQRKFQFGQLQPQQLVQLHLTNIFSKKGWSCFLWGNFIPDLSTQINNGKDPEFSIFLQMKKAIFHSVVRCLEHQIDLTTTFWVTPAALSLDSRLCSSKIAKLCLSTCLVCSLEPTLKESPHSL